MVSRSLVFEGGGGNREPCRETEREREELRIPTQISCSQSGTNEMTRFITVRKVEEIT